MLFACGSFQTPGRLLRSPGSQCTSCTSAARSHTAPQSQALLSLPMGHHTEEEAQVAGGAQVCDSLELVLSETVIVSLDRMRFTVDGTACDPGGPDHPALTHLHGRSSVDQQAAVRGVVDSAFC